MQKFLIDGTVFEQPLTGVAKVTICLYQSLLQIDNTFEITICHRRPLCGMIPSSFKTVTIPAHSDSQWRTEILPQYLQDNNYDIIHFPWNNGVPANLPSHVTTILTLHDVLPLMIPRYFRNPFKKLSYKKSVLRSLQRADLTITDSYFSRQKIVDYFAPATAPTVIYPASPLQTNHKISSPSSAQKYFFYCGGYDKRKGIQLLLKTFLHLWQHENLKIPLWIAGEPQRCSTEISQLFQMAKSRGIIKELGYISDLDLIEYYQNAIALVYPSRYEGFGLPPLEAMTFGCPVITYRLSSLPEVCNAAALYIDPKDDDSLGKIIIELANNEISRAHYSQLGLQQAQQFSWDKSARTFLQAVKRTTHTNKQAL